jgi:hypothetical protein
MTTTTTTMRRHETPPGRQADGVITLPHEVPA